MANSVFDIFIIPYGPKKWAFRFRGKKVQKVCKSKEAAITYARKVSSLYAHSDLYIENDEGEFIWIEKNGD